MAGSAPPSSGNQLWDTWAEQDAELRVLAQRIWQVSQDLDVSTGYTGVAQMLEIDDKLPLSVKVKSQVRRLNALKDLDKWLASKALASAGHNRDILDGRGGGSQQRDLNAASKRTAEGPLATAGLAPSQTPSARELPRIIQVLIHHFRPPSKRWGFGIAIK